MITVCIYIYIYVYHLKKQSPKWKPFGLQTVNPALALATRLTLVPWILRSQGFQQEPKSPKMADSCELFIDQTNWCRDWKFLGTSLKKEWTSIPNQQCRWLASRLQVIYTLFSIHRRSLNLAVRSFNLPRGSGNCGGSAKSANLRTPSEVLTCEKQ